MEHKVHFVVAALGRDCDEFTLHIYASLAEQERKLIADRCRAAAAILKRKGEKFGFGRSKALLRRVRPLSMAAQQRATMERAKASARTSSGPCDSLAARRDRLHSTLRPKG